RSPSRWRLPTSSPFSIARWRNEQEAGLPTPFPSLGRAEREFDRAAQPGGIEVERDAAVEVAAEGAAEEARAEAGARRLDHRRAAALEPDECQAPPAAGDVDRPGHREPSVGGGERAVFPRIGRELVQAQGHGQALL